MADQITDALDRILSRLDALEAKVDAATGGGLESAPTEIYRGGPQVPDLASRLQDPAVAHGLNRLLDRLDRVEAAVDAFGHLASRVHLAGDALAESASFAFQQAEAHGIDPVAAGTAAAGLAAKAAQPRALSLVDKALDQTDLAHRLLDSAPLLDKVLETTPMLEKILDNGPVLEVLASALGQVSADDLRTLTTEGASLLPRLATLMRSPEFTKLAESLEAGVSVASSASTALVETRSQPIQPVGAFGAFFKMGDPDVQRAVGFTLTLAKAFGAKL